MSTPAEETFLQAARELEALAQDRFNRGEKPTPNEIVAMALVHPDTFEVMVRTTKGETDG